MRGVFGVFLRVFWLLLGCLGWVYGGVDCFLVSLMFVWWLVD